MRTQLALALAVAALASPAAEAAKRKPISGSYDLFLPVPNPQEDAGGSHCKTAQEGLSLHVHRLTVPAPGRFAMTLDDVVGDWVIEVYDAKGARVAQSGTLAVPPAPATVSFRNKRAGKTAYTIMICNYAGGPRGTGTWRYDFS